MTGASAKVALVGATMLPAFCAGKAQTPAGGPDPLPRKPVPLSELLVGAGQLGILVEASDRRNGVDHFVVLDTNGVPLVQEGRIDGNFALAALNLVHNPYDHIRWLPSRALAETARPVATLVKTLTSDAEAARPLSSVGSPCNKVAAIGTVHSPLDVMHRQPEPPAIIRWVATRGPTRCAPT